MPPRLKSASAKTRTPMITESQSSLRLSFAAAAPADFTAMSDIFVPRRAALARSYEMCRPIKSRPVKLTISQNSFLRGGRRMSLLRTSSRRGHASFLIALTVSVAEHGDDIWMRTFVNRGRSITLCVRDARRLSQARALGDGLRKRAVDDVGCQQPLPDQPGPEIEINGLL